MRWMDGRPWTSSDDLLGVSTAACDEWLMSPGCSVFRSDLAPPLASVRNVECWTLIGFVTDLPLSAFAKRRAAERS
jgi:hypothetical protein